MKMAAGWRVEWRGNLTFNGRVSNIATIKPWHLGKQSLSVRMIGMIVQFSGLTNFDYAPFNTTESRRRIRQQLSLGAGATDARPKYP